MGISIGLSRDFNTKYVTTNYPDIKEFKVLVEHKISEYLLVLVRYKCYIPNNYDGNKLLLYKGIDTIKYEKEIDPHFIENEFSPIARFKPDEEGLKLAVNIMAILHAQELDSIKGD